MANAAAIQHESGGGQRRGGGGGGGAAAVGAAAGRTGRPSRGADAINYTTVARCNAAGLAAWRYGARVGRRGVVVGWPWWDESLVCEEEEQGEREQGRGMGRGRTRQQGNTPGRGRKGERGGGREGGVGRTRHETRKSTASWVGGEC